MEDLKALVQHSEPVSSHQPVYLDQYFIEPSITPPTRTLSEKSQDTLEPCWKALEPALDEFIDRYRDLVCHESIHLPQNVYESSNRLLEHIQTMEKAHQDHEACIEYKATLTRLVEETRIEEWQSHLPLKWLSPVPNVKPGF